jgi:hypothetical protein
MCKNVNSWRGHDHLSFFPFPFHVNVSCNRFQSKELGHFPHAKEVQVFSFNFVAKSNTKVTYMYISCIFISNIINKALYSICHKAMKAKLERERWERKTDWYSKLKSSKKFNKLWKNGWIPCKNYHFIIIIHACFSCACKCNTFWSFLRPSFFFFRSLARIDDKLLSDQAKKKKKNEKEKNNMIQPLMPIKGPFEDIF